MRPLSCTPTRPARGTSPLPETSRAYLIASAQHGPGSLPPATNPNDFRPAIRALVHALDEWVGGGVLPPPSRYPRIADGTLVPPEKAGWPTVPGVQFPTVRHEPVRMDYGPEWARGVITIEPPRLGRVFPTLVPAVDADGNDRAGIRLPEVAVPLASQTGWRWRRPGTGAPGALAPYVGSYFPFAWTRVEREEEGDPRLSVEERYRGREDYLGRVALAAVALVRERFLLARDVPFVVERAAAHWDGRAATGSETSPESR